MTASAGKDALIQVNGTSGTWTEADARDAPPELSKESLDVTTYGDEAMKRISGLKDTSLSIETIYQDNDPVWQTDLRDSYDNGTPVDIEVALDRTAGTLFIVKFTGKVFSFTPDQTVDGEVTVTYEVELSDGNAPTFPATLS
jgi:predicted secreted protein